MNETNPGASYPFCVPAESAGGVASRAASDPRALAHESAIREDERGRLAEFFTGEAQREGNDETAYTLRRVAAVIRARRP